LSNIPNSRSTSLKIRSSPAVHTIVPA
jgi:hypothetical protein